MQIGKDTDQYKQIVAEAKAFDSFTKEFLQKHKLPNFNDLFHIKNRPILHEYLNKKEVLDYFCRREDQVLYHSSGPDYYSNYEEKFYDVCRLRGVMRIPYRTIENFLFSGSNPDIRNFISKKFFEYYNEPGNSVSDNIHINPEFKSKIDIGPFVNGKSTFTETKLFKDAESKIASSEKRHHIFLVPSYPVRVDETQKTRHASLTAIIYDKKSQSVSAILDIDHYSQAHQSMIINTTKDEFLYQEGTKTKFYSLGLNIQNNINNRDLHCVYHTYSAIKSILQASYNAPTFADQLSEKLHSKKELFPFLKKAIAKGMDTTFDLDILREKGVVKLLPTKKIALNNMMDRFAVSSAMIPDIFKNFCEKQAEVTK